MLRDLEHGKRLEIDALNGTVSRLGRQFSVPTPVNDFIYAALKIHDTPPGSTRTAGMG
jgi:2-dehydropantoate 2-reductase